MNKERSSLLPKLEIGLMLVFFVGFMFWAVSRCNATKEKYRRAAELEEMDRAAQEREEQPVTEEGQDSIQTQPPPTAPPEKITPLYVTIEGLNLRTEPNLRSEVILKLGLFEEVYFMDEVTAYKDSISLGDKMAYEPWVKVRHRRGRVGWVYGAGVHYYKVKR